MTITTNGAVTGVIQADQAAWLASSVSRYGMPSGGVYLGAAFPKKTRAGTYGRKVASWANALQNSAGTTSFVSGDLPTYADSSTRVVRIDQNAVTSFAQYSCDGSQAYMPKGTTTGTGFTAGVWVKNPGARTLSFQLQFFNVAANKNIRWNGAIEAGTGWQFITFSPSQFVNGGAWTFGTDAVSLIRVAQIDNGAEGAWLSGEYLLFGNVYVDVAARPKFLLTFDDGYSSQSARTPGLTSKVSGSAHVSSTLTNVLTTATNHALVVGEPLVFTETAPTSLTTGTTYYVQTTPAANTFTLATDAALSTTATTTGFAGTAKYQYGGSQSRSVQDLVESYGFRGSLFIVPLWLGSSGQYAYGGTVNTFMTAADVQQMWADGWAVGSHSYTHPSNNESAGLRLLGPYGYYLSNTFDNLPAQYLTNWSITAGKGRRRVTAGTQASPSVFTTENAHQFLINQPIVFTDVAPTGCTLGTTYYVRTSPSTTTFTLATDQGTLTSAVNNTTGAFSGTCNYRHPGSSNDDSAIYADIVAGANGVAALGITTGYKFFALPQGGADEYVRSACIRAGIIWVRGVSGATNAHTIPIGKPSGANMSNIQNPGGGWIGQVDAIQTDGSLALTALDTYVNETIAQGACGCNYHHALATTNLAALDRLCGLLRTKSDARLVDVITCDELAKELGI